MTRDEVLAAVAKLVEELAGVPAETVVEGASFIDDLELDSMTITEIAAAVEDRFGVRIPDSDIGQLKSVRDLVSYISSRNPTPPSPEAEQ